VGLKKPKSGKSEKPRARRYTNRGKRRQKIKIQPVKMPVLKWEHISIAERNMDSSHRPRNPVAAAGFSKKRFLRAI